MATRASIAARVEIARTSAEASMATIAESLGVAVPDAPLVAAGKDPELRAALHGERVAAFLASVAASLPMPADEPAPESDSPGDDDADPEGEGDEPTFYGFPLSHFDGMSDTDILAIDGIGEGRLRKIREAQANP